MQGSVQGADLPPFVALAFLEGVVAVVVSWFLRFGMLIKSPLLMCSWVEVVWSVRRYW